MPLSLSPSLLMSSASSVAFSPLSLFASGEQGAWYDPSDLTTMFQDTAGTTPVTATGQTVGLLLDKSQGLVLGPELVTNGDFSAGTTGWGVGTGWTVSGGIASFSNPTGSNLSRTDLPSIPAGRLCKLEIDLNYTSGAGCAVGLNIGGGIDTFGTFTGSGRKTAYVITTTARTGIQVTGIGGSVFSIDNISVKELPGNHATQATAASRPIYGIEPAGGRRNLLTYTEQFDNAAWAKANVTAAANSLAAPDGTTTAETLRLNAGAAVSLAALGLFTAGATAYVSEPTSTALTAGAHTYTIYVRGGASLSHVQLRVGTNANLSTLVSGALVRLSDGVIVDSLATSAAVTDAGNGWWRVAISFTATAGVHHVGVWFWNSTSIPSATGNEGIYVWGAQLETGSTATAYQRVTDQWNVTEAGVPSVSYIQCDGTDDFLLTGTITPGIDKAQVFAGVRKLSDAAIGALLQSSANSSSNDGALAVGAPAGAASASYLFQSRGTAISQAIYTNAAVAAPITNVLTGIGDIAGDVATLRANGTQVATSSTDQGTGNYLAYPLYIGRRAGTSQPFNGRIYQMIVRFGANLSAATITQTETFVNSRTGAY